MKRLLTSRLDIFDDYTEEGFEVAFKTQFEILQKVSVPESERTLYLMQVKK